MEEKSTKSRPDAQCVCVCVCVGGGGYEQSLKAAGINFALSCVVLVMKRVIQAWLLSDRSRAAAALARAATAAAAATRVGQCRPLAAQ